MIRRCYKPKCCNYKHYGGRGITVCAEWLPENNGKNNFIKWSLEHGYEKNLSIDRINNDMGYSPENCRWVTKRTQNINKKSSIPSKTGFVGICVHNASYEGHVYYYGRVRGIDGKTKYTGISKSLKKAVIMRNNYIINNNLENELNLIPENMED